MVRFGSARTLRLLLGASFLVIAAGSLTLGCQRPASVSETQAETGPVWFEDVTEKVGLEFVHDVGTPGQYHMPEQVGSGAALFDFNGDGRLDIYLLQNGGPQGKKNQLFEQMPDGTFKDVSAGSGLDIAGHNMGVAIGDVNNDGLPDVLVTQYRGIKLFLNNGKNANGTVTFTEITRAAGLDNPSWATSAAFFDYNRDGWLDLVVVNYVDYDPTWPCHGPSNTRDYCSPKTFKGRVSRLYRNRGKSENAAVRFEDVTESSGLSRAPGPGLGVICADIDGDGWPDIFVANDGAVNHLWMNQRDGTFREEGGRRGLARNGMGQTQAGMGIALGDVDGDGLFDIFVTHLAEETHALWKQGPRGFFQEQTAKAGLLEARWRGTGFGTLLADFDNDGALDLVIVNGRVSARPSGVDDTLGPFWTRYGDRNQLFRNQGKGCFEDISAVNDPLCSRYNVARGVARGDFDGDGAVDLLVTTIGGPARLFRNVGPGRGHWLTVRAFDPALKRDAFGAEVRVRAGGITRTCWMHPAESYLCSSESVAHFGLGPTQEIEAIEVLWPDGVQESFAGGKADRRVEIRKGTGRSTPTR